MLSALCLLSLPIVYIAVAVEAATTTIDDAQSPAFTFVPAWNGVTPSNPCALCSLKLDASETVNGTWHDGSVAGSIGSLTFDGSGVILYGVTNAAQTCALQFVLDEGSPVNLDVSSIPLSPTNVYHYPFFNASGLSGGTHTLTWTIQTSVVNAVAVIDYAVIISDDVTSSGSGSSTSSGLALTTSAPPAASSNVPNISENSTPTVKKTEAVIVGAVLGSILGIILVASIVILLLRRRRSKYMSFAPGLEAFHSTGGSYPPEKGPRILDPPRTASSGPSPLPSPAQNNEESGPTAPSTALEGSSNTSNVEEPSAPLSAANAPIQQMERRILFLEQMLRQGAALDDTSPPPY